MKKKLEHTLSTVTESLKWLEGSVHFNFFFCVQVNFPAVYSMKLQLRRTVCKKFEESLDTCHFQQSYSPNNVRQGTHLHGFYSCEGYRDRLGQ